MYLRKTLEMRKEFIDQLVFSLNISKILSKDFKSKQLETYFESILSQYQRGFRKGFSVFYHSSSYREMEGII